MMMLRYVMISFVSGLIYLFALLENYIYARYRGILLLPSTKTVLYILKKTFLPV